MMKFRLKLALPEESLSSFFSVQSLCSPCLGGCFFAQLLTAENTEGAQRNQPFAQSHLNSLTIAFLQLGSRLSFHCTLQLGLSLVVQLLTARDPDLDFYATV